MIAVLVVGVLTLVCTIIRTEYIAAPVMLALFAVLVPLVGPFITFVLAFLMVLGPAIVVAGVCFIPVWAYIYLIGGEED